MIIWLSLWAVAAPPTTVPEVVSAEQDRAPASTFSASLIHESAAVRAAGARALGRLGDDSVAPLLVPLLNDGDSTVRRAAAEALAIAPGTQDALLAAWAARGAPGSTADEVGALLLFGLGRRGDVSVLPVLTGALEQPGATGVAAAHALGRLGRRKVEGASAALPELISCVYKPLRPRRAQACAWAMARIGLDDATPGQRQQLADVQAVGPVTRAWLTRALAGVQDIEGIEHASQAVKVASLGKHTPADRIAEAVHSANPWVASAGRMAALRATSSPALLAALHSVAEGPDDFAAAEAIDALATMKIKPPAVAMEGSERRLAAWLQSAPKTWLWQVTPEPTVVATGLAGAVMTREAEIAEWSVSERGSLDAALKAGKDPILLQARIVRAKAEERNADLIALAGLPDGDAAEGALQALVESDLDASEKAALTLLLPSLLGHQQVRLRAAAHAVMKAHDLTASPGVPSVWGQRPELDASGITGARIRTSRGEIRVRLDGAIAPLATANFAHLAESDYYDGVVFHRVVPAFVVQAGCPRGDGWGGPGYTLPDEFSAQPYDAGALGMARSSPDTAGSQWFITTVEQPHLTGDYTWFGEVTSGMHVARSMRAGDKVLDVIIERSQ